MLFLNSDPDIESSVLVGHEDSVWGLTYSAAHHRLASCSADGTIRIWDPQNSSPCVSVFNKERGKHLFDVMAVKKEKKIKVFYKMQK